jgi:hypothetical protein
VNARVPAPVRMTTRTLSSASTARIAFASSMRSACDSAFIACGRLSVTVAMPSAMSMVTMDSDMKFSKTRASGGQA